MGGENRAIEQVDKKRGLKVGSKNLPDELEINANMYMKEVIDPRTVPISERGFKTLEEARAFVNLPNILLINGIRFVKQE